MENEDLVGRLYPSARRPQQTGRENRQQTARPNGTNLRTLFNSLREIYPGCIIGESYLQMEQVLINGNTTIEFDPAKNVNTDRRTESKLDRNDVFVATHMGLFLAANSLDATGKTKGVPVFQTYPNVQHFPAVVGPPAFEPANLEAIYNGKLTVKINNKEESPLIDARRFRYVPQTQQSSATNFSMFKLDMALVALTPTINLFGNKENKITLLLPSATNIAAQAANTENLVILFTKGFVVKGASLKN
jgi:hypothetical protein